jgi:hypothetical protein
MQRHLQPGSSALHVITAIEGEEQFYESRINQQWLKRPLLHVAIAPFLQQLQKHRPAEAKRFTLPRLRRVVCNEVELELAVAKDRVTVHSPASHVAGYVGAGGDVKLHMFLTLHTDEAMAGDVARPHFLARLLSSFGLGGELARVHVSVGGFALQTQLTRAWLARPVKAALIGPFLDAYNRSNLPGTRTKLRLELVIGLEIDGEPYKGGHQLEKTCQALGIGHAGVTSVALMLGGGLATSQDGSTTPRNVQSEIDAAKAPPAAAPTSQPNTAEAAFGIDGLDGHEFDDLLDEMVFTPRSGYAPSTPRGGPIGGSLPLGKPIGGPAVEL